MRFPGVYARSLRRQPRHRAWHVRRGLTQSVDGPPLNRLYTWEMARVPERRRAAEAALLVPSQRLFLPANRHKVLLRLRVELMERPRREVPAVFVEQLVDVEAAVLR